MSVIHTWACFLLWISFSTQNKTPDVTQTCFVSEECVLPCSFQPASEVIIEWFRQDVAVYKLEQDNDDDDSSSEERVENEQFAGRISVSPHLVSRGNASLILRKTDLKDRGTYRCHVEASDDEHDAKVILKVEAPIRNVSLEMSALSGYKEMICTIHNVYPAPRVTWATEPPTFEDLRPVTRMQGNKEGLYTIHSRLKLLDGRRNLIYICKVTTSYGGPTWTASIRENVQIKGSQGKDLTIPCHAPAYLNKPSLEWSFSNGVDHSHILTYDSQSGHSTSTASWNHHVELNGYRVPFGDGSLRLMDPKNSKHTGSYTCVFSIPYTKHTERTDVIIDGPAGTHAGEPEGRASEKSSHWWIAVLVIAGLVLGLLGLLVYFKIKGNRGQKPRNDPEEVTELKTVKDAAADSNLSETSPLNAADTNTQSGLRTDTQLT